MLDRVNAIVLPVRDVKACATFYRDQVGFRLDQLEAEEAYLTIGTGDGAVLALKSVGLVAREISEERIRPGEDVISRIHCVAFVKDVDKEYEDLRQKGVRFVSTPSTKSDGWRTAHFEDPEGNLWEIAQSPKARK